MSQGSHHAQNPQILSTLQKRVTEPLKRRKPPQEAASQVFALSNAESAVRVKSNGSSFPLVTRIPHRKEDRECGTADTQPFGIEKFCYILSSILGVDEVMGASTSRAPFQASQPLLPCSRSKYLQCRTEEGSSGLQTRVVIAPHAETLGHSTSKAKCHGFF